MVALLVAVTPTTLFYFPHIIALLLAEESNQITDIQQLC